LFHQIDHEVFEQDGTEIVVNDAKCKPDAEVSAPVKKLFGSTSSIAVGHCTDMLSSDESESHHHDDAEKIYRSEDDHRNQPEIKENEDLLVDGVLGQEAEAINVLQASRGSECLHEAVKN
jgi:hypothetical protein